ncbi:hypothetical protein [Nonlabens sp.]|uniref:hypothetical protein n=1 Tax=Nonlabens sp. TaxID=1888209 RepID=UPI003F69922E
MNINIMLFSSGVICAIVVYVIAHFSVKYMPKKRHYMYMNNVPKAARQSDEAYRLWNITFAKQLKKHCWVYGIGVIVSFFIPPFYAVDSASKELWTVVTVMVLTILIVMNIAIAYFKSLKILEETLF